MAAGNRRKFVWYGSLALIGFMLVWGFVYGCVFFVMRVGFHKADPVIIGPPVPSERVAEISKLMHLQLPPSAVALYFEYSPGFLDDEARLKVALPPRTVPELIAGSPFSVLELQSENLPSVMKSEGDPGWWAPDGAKHFLAGQVQLPEGGRLSIVVDQDDPERSIAYFFWFET